MTAPNPPMTFQAWLDHYDNEIRPLRDPADKGDATYAAYDEAYNEHLELLHQLVADKVQLLDRAQELADAASGYLDALPDFSDFELEPEETQVWDAAWERLHAVLVAIQQPCDRATASEHGTSLIPLVSQRIVFPDDVQQLRVALASRGYTASDGDIQLAYRKYSDQRWAAGWMNLDVVPMEEVIDAIVASLLQGEA